MAKQQKSKIRKEMQSISCAKKSKAFLGFEPRHSEVI